MGRGISTEANEAWKTWIHRLMQYAATDVIEAPPGPPSAELIKSPSYIWQLGDGFLVWPLTCI